MPTISEIKESTKEKSPHFFSQDTMRFFGQTMGSFKVEVSPQGGIFIYAESFDTDRGVKRSMGYTFRQFKDGDLKSIPESHKTLEEVKGYIRDH